MESMRSGYIPDGNNAKDFVLSHVDLAEIILDNTRRGLSAKFVASGFSMSPFIKDGDMLTVYACKNGEFSLGDILACRCKRNNNLIVHRLIEIKKDGFIVKGDNCSTVDEFIPGDMVLGRVGKVERCGKVQFLGLGRGKFAVALLSRSGVLCPLLGVMRKLSGCIRKRAKRR